MTAYCSEQKQHVIVTDIAHNYICLANVPLIERQRGVVVPSHYAGFFFWQK
jgi:hypothetical protein